MLARLGSLVLLALLGLTELGALAQEALTINTPTTTLSTCVNKRIQWSGGRPPYSVRVFPGGQLDADPLAVIALNTQDTNAVWRCTVQAGQSVTFAVEDDNGDVNGSAQVTVSENPSGDNSCLSGDSRSTTSTSAADATSASSDSPSASASASSVEASSVSASSNSVTSASARSQSSAAASSSRAAASSSSSKAADAAETGPAAASPQSAAVQQALVDVGALLGSLFLATAYAF